MLRAVALCEFVMRPGLVKALEHHQWVKPRPYAVSQGAPAKKPG